MLNATADSDSETDLLIVKTLTYHAFGSDDEAVACYEELDASRNPHEDLMDESERHQRQTCESDRFRGCGSADGSRRHDERRATRGGQDTSAENAATGLHDCRTIGSRCHHWGSDCPATSCCSVGPRVRTTRGPLQNNLKQQILAVHAYHDTHGIIPPVYNGSKDPFAGFLLGITSHSWRSVVLPYMEQQALFDRIDFDSYATDAVNQPAANTPLEVFSAAQARPGRAKWCDRTMGGRGQLDEARYPPP